MDQADLGIKHVFKKMILFIYLKELQKKEIEIMLFHPLVFFKMAIACPLRVPVVMEFLLPVLLFLAL